jgi:hypothetical protein
MPAPDQTAYATPLGVVGEVDLAVEVGVVVEGGDADPVDVADPCLNRIAPGSYCETIGCPARLRGELADKRMVEPVRPGWWAISDKGAGAGRCGEPEWARSIQRKMRWTK